MLRSLNSGVTAMQQFQGQMDVIGNNIANVNTTGFKGARVNFSDSLSQTIQGAGPGGSMQIGTGVTTGAISNQFVQGAVTPTGVKTDLAIGGDGFFVVRDPNTGSTYATRAGDFHIDTGGYLVTSTGMRVQGFTDAGLTTRGDIQIDNGGAASPMASFNFNNKGVVTVTLEDGTDITRGQVLLQNFLSPESLIKEGSNLYSGLAAAGPLSQTEPSGTNGLGSIQSSALEMSNVDLANEFATLITTQRAFQASARIITTSDEMLQELINLKR